MYSVGVQGPFEFLSVGKRGFRNAGRTLVLGMAVVGAVGVAGAQATGDGRGTVTEPVFPVVCTQVAADLTISGGEPSSEINTAHDTSIIQTALSGCAQGRAVELVSSGSNNAFVIAPIFIPAGVTLLVDGGVTVFGSRNAVDYQIGTASSGNTCGTSDSGSACRALITLGQSSVGGQSTTSYTGSNPVTGIMGYGVINGRGADKLITVDNQANPTTYTVGSSSWYDLAVGGNEDNPVLIQNYKTPNTVLYKITMLNSPHFHVRITGQGSTTSTKVTNFTVWGVKLLTPFSAHNTDGIDPTGTTNVSILNSIIGDGDDEIAISGSSPGQNFTFSNLLLTSGHGVSVGSITTSGVSNILASNLNFSGQPADPNAIAVRIKSYCSVGGPVSNVTYNGVCVRNVATAIDLDPFYAAGSGTASCPAFGTASAPITYQNLYLTTANAKINFQGLNATTGLSNVVLNNVYSNSASLNLAVNQSADTTPTPANDAITLNGTYFPTAWGTLASNANAVTETVNGTTAAAFPTAYCANAFPAIEGELFASTTSGGTTVNNINTSATVTLPATVTLGAMVQPTNSTTSFGAYTGVAAPTASVQFYDGATLVGTGTLGTNGTLASVTLTNPTAGTHTYTATYVGDGTYSATTFGTTTYTGTQNGTAPAATPLTVTVTAGPASKLGFTTAPASTLVYGNSAGTVQVAVEDVAGDVLSSTASVTLTITSGASTVATYTANAVNGTATFNVTNVLPVGSYTYTATSSGVTSATAGESVTQATLQVTANAASRVYGAANPALTYAITGYVNGDTSSMVSGAATLSTTAVRTSAAGMYPINVTQGTLSAANYTFQLNANTLTVTGGAAQTIVFSALPNFPHGASYQLTARTSSGLTPTYSVSGAATVSGTTLTVTGTGSVTVTASSAVSGNYAAAANVAQGFVAQ